MSDGIISATPITSAPTVFITGPGTDTTNLVVNQSFSFAHRCLDIAERNKIAACAIAAVTIAIIATALADVTSGSFSDLMIFTRGMAIIAAAVCVCAGAFQMAKSAGLFGHSAKTA